MPQVRERPQVEFDEDGLLMDPAQWNETVAQDIAWQYEIGRLTDEHWKVIHALREHYSKFGVAPATSHFCRVHGRDRHWIHDLFHSCLNAWRVSGLPNPGEEAKSYMM